MMMILNAFSVFLLWSLSAALEPEVLQRISFQRAKVGETVEITCHIYSSGRTSVWYKLTHNRRLELLASTDVLFNHSTVSEKFRNRFSVKLSPVVSTLKILNAEWGDDGTYYCGVLNLEDVTFGSGTIVEVEGESKLMQSVLQSPEYIRVQPGDSVTLSCSFNPSLCPQEHTSVTWIKSGSQTVSWNFENISMNCEVREDGETSCVHNLILTEVGSAENGTFLCVVTACGNTMLGPGTRIEMYNKSTPSVLVQVLSGALVGTLILCVLLSLVIYKIKKKSQPTMTAENEEDIHYAALKHQSSSRPRSHADSTNTECVYSGVRL
ncbi:V-set and immunoglobulin domain-containing protein 1-like [Boleophthalmus pectinirostris]|uniref:V-set and immunoglobulin domain-containing protein 1-like n=1 Tax=Boleophthalmus pectinirostris TaxID=150288 RepID=UPI00242BA1EA|nr:V-set and immunoglobulin domain-containing protein 1-like [Boleophthalmus pectinirostris]